MTSTRFITVPYITNTKELAEGDELIVQHFPRAATPANKKRAQTWRDVHAAEVKKKRLMRTPLKSNKKKAELPQLRMEHDDRSI